MKNYSISFIYTLVPSNFFLFFSFLFSSSSACVHWNFDSNWLVAMKIHGKTIVFWYHICYLARSTWIPNQNICFVYDSCCVYARLRRVFIPFCLMVQFTLRNLFRGLVCGLAIININKLHSLFAILRYYTVLNKRVGAFTANRTTEWASFCFHELLWCPFHNEFQRYYVCVFTNLMWMRAKKKNHNYTFGIL